uniref:Uncharacterized protein n=1 Tax=Macaca fascicularis TaxID=9541 RepID=Q863D1_MACFA|nr:hypothetical protein [Macaca fascicularis]
MGQSSHSPLHILDFHSPNLQQVGPNPLHLCVFFQKMHFGSERSIFLEGHLLRPLLAVIVQSRNLQLFRELPSHRSAQPCYLTSALAIVVKGPASSLF